jgi:hypothetical protein
MLQRLVDVITLIRPIFRAHHQHDFQRFTGRGAFSTRQLQAAICAQGAQDYVRESHGYLRAVRLPRCSLGSIDNIWMSFRPGDDQLLEKTQCLKSRRNLTVETSRLWMSPVGLVQALVTTLCGLLIQPKFLSFVLLAARCHAGPPAFSWQFISSVSGHLVS